MQKEGYLIKNACYSVTKYYLCKQNNKRSLLGRKQRSQVARSFLNRYQLSCTNNATSLFSIRYILIIIFQRERTSTKFAGSYRKLNYGTMVTLLSTLQSNQHLFIYYPYDLQA